MAQTQATKAKDRRRAPSAGVARSGAIQHPAKSALISLQQSAGNRAIATALQAKQGRPATKSTGSTAASKNGKAAASATKPAPIDEKKVTEIATEIGALLESTLTALELKQQWPKLSKQITAPVVNDKAKGDLQAVYKAEIVEKLKARTKEERAAIAQQVHDQLIAHVSGMTIAEITAEYNSLDKFVRGNIEGGVRGYAVTRSGLLNTFGSIVKINEYYQSLVEADFPSASSKVKGRKTPVHPNLRERLQRAAKVLTTRKIGAKSWLDIVEDGIRGLGGFNIRENRNNTARLSDHSFGWAIDIDATINPNVSSKAFPTKQVKEFTGVDVYKGDAAAKVRAGGTTDDLLQHTRSLRESSDKFKRAFDSETALKEAVDAYLRGRGLALSSEKLAELFGLLAEKSKKEKDKVNRVVKWLSDAKATATKDEKAAATEKPGSPTTWADAPSAAGFLIQTYSTFKQSTTATGAKVAPSTVGNAGTVAAHGFINLPAELIAALVGSDGGGLKWLGAVEKGTKDFMHFELRVSDQPTLPKADATPPVPTSEGPVPK